MIVSTGKSRLDRELLDAAEMAGHLVPPGSVSAFLAEHRRELFPDEFIADLFESRTGRPSLSADLVGSVRAGPWARTGRCAIYDTRRPIGWHVIRCCR